MFKKISQQVLNRILLSISVITLLSSCGGGDVKHSNYIPANSCFVMSLNTEEIFSDAFFDLISNNDFTADMVEGPLADIMQDPANAGIKRLTKYYLYGAGANILEGKMGAILPLNDKEKLAQYIEKNWPDVEVTEDNGLLAAEISAEHNVVWNDNTALYFFTPFGGDVFTQAVSLFKQTDEQSLTNTDSTFAYAMNNDAHVAAWLKNDDFAAFADEGLKMVKNFNLFDTFGVNKEDIKGAKTVFLANFNDGNITVEQRQYLNATQMSIYNSFQKENNVSGLTKIASNSNPKLAISASLNSEGLKALLKEYNMDEMWKGITKNSLLQSVELSQLSQYFDGDVLVLVNGLDMVSKTITTSDLDDEGNDIEVKKDVTNPVPNVAIGLTMKDAEKFNLSLGMVAAMLPKYEGYSSYNDEVFFKVTDDLMVVTLSKQGVDALNSAKGELNPEVLDLVSKHRTSAFIDFAGVLGEVKGMMPLQIEALDNLKSLSVSEKGIAKEGVIEGKTVLKFNNNDNGLISTMKLIDGLSGIFGLLAGQLPI